MSVVFIENSKVRRYILNSLKEPDPYIEIKVDFIIENGIKIYPLMPLMSIENFLKIPYKFLMSETGSSLSFIKDNLEGSFLFTQLRINSNFRNILGVTCEENAALFRLAME